MQLQENTPLQSLFLKGSEGVGGGKSPAQACNGGRERKRGLTNVGLQPVGFFFSSP